MATGYFHPSEKKKTPLYISSSHILIPFTLSSVLLNNANQLLISLAGQLTHPNVSGTVLVVTYPDDHPEQNIGNQSKKIPPMAAQIPRRPRPEHGPRPPRPRRRSTVASPKGPQSDAAWRGRVAPGGGSEDGHRSGAAPAPTAAPFLSRRHVCSNELVGFSGVVAGTASGRAMPPS